MNAAQRYLRRVLPGISLLPVRQYRVEIDGDVEVVWAADTHDAMVEAMIRVGGGEIGNVTDLSGRVSK